MSHSASCAPSRTHAKLASGHLTHRFLALLALTLLAAPVGQAQQDELPEAELILDTFVQVTGGEAAYARLENRVEEIAVEPVGFGMTLSATAYHARPDRTYFLIEGGPIGRLERGTRDGVAWELSSRTGPVIQEGAERDRMLRTAAFDRIPGWRELFEKTECVGVEPVDGRPCYKVVLTPKAGEPETHYYDKETGFIRKLEESSRGSVQSEWFLGDFEEVDGVLFPHEYRHVGEGRTTRFALRSIRNNTEIPADRFELPDEVLSLLRGEGPDLRQLDLESFERVWSLVNDRYWDPDFGGLDWQAVGDELRPRILEATSRSEARAVLRDMISRLELSHFAIIPPDAPDDGGRPSYAGAAGGETGIDARVIEGKALVTSVAEGSTAERVGVQPGWEITRVGDFDVVASLERLDRELPDTPSKRVKMAAGVVVRVRSGVGESVPIAFRDGQGELVELAVPLGEPRGRRASIGNFGHARVRIDVRTLEGGIGYVAINTFLDPFRTLGTFGGAMKSFMKADGIIIDLRGNGGGKDAIAMAMMGWLAPRKWVAGRIRTRRHEHEMTVRPRAQTYDGPVAVLTDGLTGSSAEFVAAALQEMGRAHVIGTRTKGEALPANYTTLPNGDVFLYAVSDFVTGAGERLEGVGVAPDLEVALTRASLLEGRDIVLEAAVDWIRAQD